MGFSERRDIILNWTDKNTHETKKQTKNNNNKKQQQKQTHTSTTSNNQEHNNTEKALSITVMLRFEFFYERYYY